MNRKQRRLAARGKTSTGAALTAAGWTRRSDAVQGTLEAAVRHHQAGEFKRAAKLYQEASKRDPNNADILHLLAVVTHQTGRTDRAIQYLQRAIALRPDSPEFHSNLGNLLKARGKLDDAVAHYQEALRLKPDFADAYNNLANALQDQGRLDEAVRHYERALELNPNSALVHNNLGVACKDQGKLAQAARHYEKAIAVDPAYSEAHNNFGNVLRAQGLLDEAVRHYEKAVALKPDLADAHLALGELRVGQGLLDRAASHYRAAISVKPDFAQAYAGLGNLLHRQGNPDEALGFVKEALALDSDLAPARKGFAALLKYATSETYEPALEPELKASLASADVETQDLAHVTASQLKLKYEPSGGIGGSSGGLWGDGLVERIGSDGLFLSFLMKTVNVDGGLELFLTRLRRELLLEIQGKPVLAKPARKLASALAQQCFNNDYVFATQPDEDRAVGDLAQAIGHGLPSSNGEIRDLEARLLLFGMYAPLSDLPCARVLKDTPLDEWSADLRPIVERTLLDYFEERAIEDEIPSLKDVTDETSRAVRSQYEESPYPRWISLAREEPGNYADILRHGFPQFAPPPHLSGPIKVLVAGCGTGKHPLRVAMSYAGAEVVAVDFSRRSLAYAKRMAGRLGVTNVEFLQADILDLGALEQRFDVIESVGVLHHMEDPRQGWRLLSSLLVPGGIMEIGLYSETARRDVVRARERIEKLGLKPVREDIRAFRTRVLKGEEGDLVRLLDSEDFFSLSGCRDLLFNVKEHRFTLREIKTIFFPQDRDMTDLDCWDKFEDVLPNAFCELYQFVCQKPADA
jgi:tetratricopeptide (TPR) repeat protein/SAM-dependent methyltransferase